MVLTREAAETEEDDLLRRDLEATLASLGSPVSLGTRVKARVDPSPASASIATRWGIFRGTVPREATPSSLVPNLVLQCRHQLLCSQHRLISPSRCSLGPLHLSGRLMLGRPTRGRLSLFRLRILTLRGQWLRVSLKHSSFPFVYLL